MSKYFLIGEKLGHSFSVVLHQSFGNQGYYLKEIPKNEIDDFFKEADYDGINVTIPYKEVAMKYCIPNETSKTIGCVNTLVKKDGQVYGYNTDYFGFMYMTVDAGIEMLGKRVLVLGSGGTSKTATYSCGAMGAKEVIIMSRSGKSFDMDITMPIISATYEEAYKYLDVDIIVNTTPVGMYPNNQAMPIDINKFTNLSGVIDVIYNPLNTRMILEAKKKGIPSVSGLAMLVAQAYYAEELFFGREIILGNKEINDKIKKVYEVVKKDKENFVLIGMPGSGKSTISEAMSTYLGREVLDTDDLFTKNFGITPGECITKEGEPAFRDKEAEIIRRVSANTGVIISTGGGAVTRRENIDNLCGNGVFIYLKRPLEKLSTEGRPLSQKMGVDTIYNNRKIIYESIADITVDVDDDPDVTMQRLMEQVE